MINLGVSYLKYNKKQTFTIILGVVLASILLFSVGILFSSFRKYLIKKVSYENDYHVKIKGNLGSLYDDEILSLKFKDNEYFIKFKNIKDSYKMVNKICDKRMCEDIIYNVKLLSLYGIGDSNYITILKKVIISICVILSIAVFFIIYNSFLISLYKRKKDILLFKMVGLTNGEVGKLFFKEGLFYGFLGILIGFLFSLGINLGFISLINNFLYEVLNDKLRLTIYIPFILICLFFLFLIILFASVLPIFKIKKYKESYDIKDEKMNFGFKNFILGYAYTNYRRNYKKYKSLIICIFILMILFNSAFRLKSYTLKILDEYINIPNYDVWIGTNMDNEIDGIVNNLMAYKKSLYKSCNQELKVTFGDYFKKVNYALVTNLGGNSVINLVDDVVQNKKVNYKVFNNLSMVNLNGIDVKVKLTDDIPFGFDNLLIDGRVVINLDDDNFNKVCPIYENNIVIKTKEKGLDEIITNYVKENNLDDVRYINVKKAYEIMNNFVWLIKLFVIFSIILIGLISLFTVMNIISANINIRKKEFACLKCLGLTNLKISFCLLFESLIICLKGCLYAFPFILIICKFIYENIGKIFEVNLGIFDYGLYFLSFIFIFILVFILMVICHLSLYKKPLIYSIKCDNF